jgi:hypothetical protein
LNKGIITTELALPAKLEGTGGGVKGLDLNPAMEVGDEGVLSGIATLSHALSIGKDVSRRIRNFDSVTLGNDESHSTHCIPRTKVRAIHHFRNGSGRKVGTVKLVKAGV